MGARPLQKVIDQNINATSSRLNVANLNTGTYLMQVRVDGKTAKSKKSKVQKVDG